MDLLHFVGGPDQVGQLVEAVPVGHHVAVSLPHHADQAVVVVAVQRHVLGQLRAEAEVRDVDHAAPGPRTVHHAALRDGRLPSMYIVVHMGD